MVNTGLSNKIRNLAEARYVYPAIRSGKQQFFIRVRDVLKDLEGEGIKHGGRAAQICSALQTAKFLNANGLDIEAVDGPPKKQSPTVVVHYRIKGNSLSSNGARPPMAQPAGPKPSESSSERAFRLTEKLRGLLKEEMAAFGGGEAFLRWVRSEDEEPK